MKTIDAQIGTVAKVDGVVIAENETERKILAALAKTLDGNIDRIGDRDCEVKNVSDYQDGEGRFFADAVEPYTDDQVAAMEQNLILNWVEPITHRVSVIVRDDGTVPSLYIDFLGFDGDGASGHTPGPECAACKRVRELESRRKQRCPDSFGTSEEDL